MFAHKETKWRILAHKPAKSPISSIFSHKFPHRLMGGRRSHSGPYVLHSVTMADQEQQQRPLLRNIRARRDILHEFGDEDLIKRYRLNRAGILFVTDLVRETLESDTKRNRALTPEMKVIITLRYLATGKLQ